MSEHAVTYEKRKRVIRYARKPSPEQLRLQEEAENKRPKELVNHPLLHFEMDQEPEVLQFLSEYAREDHEYSQRLQGMIDYEMATLGQLGKVLRSAKQILGQPPLELSWEERLNILSSRA
ncbi:hypothetical protein BGZ95_009686 [Linnemannia exigua]|uniref:Uncharacterized protein n=1 Tax=Linnemannia exigua TaxID=604196 RepID=A0AAD4DEK0_9FUNG|nr:hypothetical protein BGZ95_009686 [Linnemannia exigua]